MITKTFPADSRKSLHLPKSLRETAADLFAYPERLSFAAHLAALAELVRVSPDRYPNDSPGAAQLEASLRPGH